MKYDFSHNLKWDSELKVQWLKIHANALSM